MFSLLKKRKRRRPSVPENFFGEAHGTSIAELPEETPPSPLEPLPIDDLLAAHLDSGAAQVMDLIPASELPPAAARMAELFRGEISPEEAPAEENLSENPPISSTMASAFAADLINSAEEDFFSVAAQMLIPIPEEPAIRAVDHLLAEESAIAIPEVTEAVTTDEPVIVPSQENTTPADRAVNIEPLTEPEEFASLPISQEAAAEAPIAQSAAEPWPELALPEIAPPETLAGETVLPETETASASDNQDLGPVPGENAAVASPEPSVDDTISPCLVEAPSALPAACIETDLPEESTPENARSEVVVSPVIAAEENIAVAAPPETPVKETVFPFLVEPAPIPPAAEPDSPLPAESDWALEEKLAGHVEWLESKGASGKRAAFACANLEALELISVNLRNADLRDANLKATDLLLADLRDASLIRANLQDSCLVGTKLEGANLEGAALESALGLTARQLAGTNLRHANLPKTILKFDALREFERAAKMASAFFAVTMAMCLLSWLAIWRTGDVQLLSNLSILGFLRSSAGVAALPTDQFYLIAPFALFLVGLVFHFHVQRLADATLQLPAVFPDGHNLSEHASRLVNGLLRAHFHWMNRDASSAPLIEKAVAMLVAYWLVPLTLLLYWMRYLTLQDVHGTILHVLLVSVASGIAIYSTMLIGRPAEKPSHPRNPVLRTLAKLVRVNPALLAASLGLLLALVSIGTMAGIPHDIVRAPQFHSGSIRRWASGALWSLDYEPYARLNEASLSVPPQKWPNTSDLSNVKGANLSNVNFRYAQAYGIFLANAHLFQSNFQGAFLSASDFRSADLGQSNFRFAVLDEARMDHANLDRANLSGANLERTDLRDANLSYVLLNAAYMKDALLTNATLYGAHLNFATMVRTNFEKSDLREAILEDSNLDHADLQQAYLWSAKLANAHLDNAQLGGAIFIGADLRNADLRGAHMMETVLSEANLAGANLDGLDLRGASGLTAAQVCSAKSRRWVALNDVLQTQVTAQCGAAR